MRLCPYVYCRRPLEGSGPCAHCGHPPDAATLRDPEFFYESVQALVDMPRVKLDLHQFLPAYPGIERIQLAAMDALGIERTLLQSAPDEATALLGNTALAAIGAGAPSRFWVSQFIDPMRPTAVADLERVHAQGHRVVKLLPVSGWRADDPALRPFWETMQALHLVAMVHTGFFTARHKSDEARTGHYLASGFADPILFDRPCREFPELTVVLCHMGGRMWCQGAAEMVSQHEHVWGDVSASGIFALESLLRGPGLDWQKVFWGNDSPPFAYCLNLRLLRDVLDASGSAALLDPLLHDNGAAFEARYLE